MSDDDSDDDITSALDSLIAAYEALPQERKDEIQREQDERAAQAERDRAANLRRDIRRDLRAGDFPWAAIESAFSVIDGDGKDTPALSRARKYVAESLLENRSLLVLSGGVGTGKTTAATWIAATVRRSRPRFMRASTFARTSRYDAVATAAWSKAGALVLDDLGAEYADSKGSFLTDFDELLDTFYADRRPLIITTNLSRDEFRDRYGGNDGRIVSRIREAGAWVACGGDDLRKGPAQ